MKIKSFFKNLNGDIYVLNINTSDNSNLKNESINAMKNKNMKDFKYVKSEEDDGPFYISINSISLQETFKGAI